MADSGGVRWDRDELSLQVGRRPWTVEAVNARHWASPKPARRRAQLALRPAELGLLQRHREQLRGDVLELGTAGGSLTAALALGARSLTGLGPSQAAVDRCRERHPACTFVQRDPRDVHFLDDGRFDAAVAGHRWLDLLSDGPRRDLLAELHRLLVVGGLLIFSAHNLGCESLVRPPSRNLGWNPLRAAPRLVRLPRALRNRAQLGPLQQRELGYAVLNEPADDYATLQYYISRDAQERQLGEHGFELLECVTLDGEPVGPGAFAYGHHELYYAARAV